MDTFDVILTARSNTDLKPEEFERQKAMIKPLMEWDAATWTWQIRLSSGPRSVEERKRTLSRLAQLTESA
jgi:hypothetical protein